MPRVWTPVEEFPFRPLRYAGVVLIFLGLASIILDLVDIVWTASKYTSDCNPADFNLWAPCNNDVLKWTWVASGVWGGLFMIIAGAVGWNMRCRKTDNLRMLRNIYGVMIMLLITIVAPVIIILQSLEIYYGVDLFYYWLSGSFSVRDEVKFIMPVIVACLAFVAWLMAIISSWLICCCAHFIQEDEYEGRVNGWLDRTASYRERDPDYCSHRRVRRRDPDYEDRRSRPRCADRCPDFEYGYLPTPMVTPYRPQIYASCVMDRPRCPAPPRPRPISLPMATLPAMPVMGVPTMMTASNPSLSSMPAAGPLYASPYAPFAFGSSWVG